MENIEAMLCAYIEGDLDEAGRAQIEKHLEEHPQHRKLIEELMATRDLVRELPRVKAPGDVGESLRGQVERSILLDDTSHVRPGRAQAELWPQLLAIAAILLLCASLGLVLYRAIAPTLRPAAEYTAERAVPAQSENKSVENTVPAAPLAPTFAAPAQPPVVAQRAAPSVAAGDQSLAMGARNAGTADTLASRSVPAVVPIMPNNVSGLRRRLQESGYAVPISTGAAGAPVLLVVNSSDPAAANARITKFLNDTGGISWRMVPGESHLKSEATTQPAASPATPAPGKAEYVFQAARLQSAPYAGAQRQQDSPALGDKVQQNTAQNAVANIYDEAAKNQIQNAPGTQLSSNLYVASGLTSQEAESLRDSLAGSDGNGQCQVFLQSAAALATTQPSMNLAGGLLQSQASAASPATQSSPATAPSVPGGFDMTALPLEARKHSVEIRPAVIDAVIVVQPGGPAVPQAVGTVTAGSATQPGPQVMDGKGIVAAPASQPSPATQP